jgi:hypothetical protein
VNCLPSLATIIVRIPTLFVSLFCIRVRNACPRPSGRLPSAESASDFGLLSSHTQRTPSSQRPQCVRAFTSHRIIPVAHTGRHCPSVPFAVSTPGSHAVGSLGRLVWSVPRAQGARAVRVSACSGHPRQWLSSLSQLKAHRQLVSQTRTPESYPSQQLLGRLGPARQTYVRLTYLIFFFSPAFFTFSPQNALFRHNRFYTLFFSMKMVESEKIV